MKKRNSLHISATYFFFVFSILMLVSCQSSMLDIGDPTAPDLEQMVKETLQSVDMQFTQTSVYNLRETANAESLAIEVTQRVGTPPPSIQTKFEGLPEEHYIWNIWGHHQYFAIGCEAATIRDWAKYFGVDIHESNFQFQLPISDNPDYGFVGVVTDPWGQVPPYSYGVHAYPVTNLLRSSYGIPARGIKGFTLERLKAEIAHDQPVVAWVIGNVVGGVPYEYMDREGRKVTVAAYEHTVIVTGFNASTIRYMNNGKFYDIPTGVFENSWSILGNMVIIWEK